MPPLGGPQAPGGVPKGRQSLDSAHTLACLPARVPAILLPARSYLVLFLKFIASVVPTIEYDYTMAAGGQH